MFMLDTNAIIMAMKHTDWPIFQKLEEHVGKDLCISVITLGELEYGIRKSRDPVKQRAGVYKFLAGIPVIDFDSVAAQHFGDIYGELELSGRRISDRDTLIAAHARSLGYTIVTNNIREFSRVPGLICADWSNIKG